MKGGCVVTSFLEEPVGLVEYSMISLMRCLSLPVMPSAEARLPKISDRGSAKGCGRFLPRGLAGCGWGGMNSTAWL